MKIALIVLDSLRYDVSIETKTNNLNTLINKYSNQSDWYKVYANCTYTYPAHISMLCAGIFPCAYNAPEPFGHSSSLFSIENKTKKHGRFKLKHPEGISRHFANKGFKTIGIGGVNWFNPNNNNCKIWKELFHEYYWKQEYNQYNKKSLDEQIKKIDSVVKKDEDLFLFLNVSLTHEPFCWYGNSKEGQSMALQDIDKKINEIIEILSPPLKLILVSDHGNCFGEDGKWGRGFYHQKIMEVPMAFLEVA